MNIITRNLLHAQLLHQLARRVMLKIASAGLDIQTVRINHVIVLLDCRRERHTARRRIKIVTVFHNLNYSAKSETDRNLL